MIPDKKSVNLVSDDGLVPSGTGIGTISFGGTISSSGATGNGLVTGTV